MFPYNSRNVLVNFVEKPQLKIIIFKKFKHLHKGFVVNRPLPSFHGGSRTWCAYIPLRNWKGVSHTNIWY